MQHIVIIGNGIAGITAARHIRKKSNDRITVISGETDHFFSRTALMYIYMGHMKYQNTKPYEDWFWPKNNIELKRAWVKNVDFDKKALEFDDGESLGYDKLVLATGSKSNKFGWPGQDLDGVQGLYSYQDLESLEKNTKGIEQAVVIGGGLIGIELAEMLHSRGIHVTYLVREPHFWSIVLPENEAKLIDRHILENGIDLRLSTELDEIVDDGTGRVKAIKTKSGDVIDCQLVGLTVGVSPNIAFLKETKLETDRGILVDEFLQTNIPDVFAIGDCAQMRSPQPHRRPIEAVWYVGRMMGETVAQTLTGKKTAYEPGIWFNSAKFFDIEYQTYGTVASQLRENERQFFWECTDRKKCINIVYDDKDFSVLGINTFGVRMRHEVWDRWIKEKATLDYVVEHLREANFDPEFFKQYDPEIQQLYNREFPDKQVKVRGRSLVEKIFG
ncbi:MAG: FAD-dependent oxidoreductase [Cyclobacteriaceae bacterium]|nr:FAD-dependent oxidoreductase [Cyclobacteriaceae bacterium HetDA_MAG_MS6]